MDPRDLVASDSLLTDRVRLAIMATLAVSDEPVEFTTLLTSLDLSKGNLASHLKKLEEGKLIKVVKEFVARKPRTTYACTARGKSELKSYVERLETLLRGVKDS